MDKPFKYIVESAVYNLRWGGRYRWGNNNDKETIDQCITQTALYYDQDAVTPAQFKQMVDKITSGASNSPIVSRNCVDKTVQAISIYYPKHMSTTNVTSLVKCLTSKDTLSVEYIESTGYKFSSAQIKVLNKAGIMMIDKMDKMSLAEFYSLFDNDAFKGKIKNGWDVDPDKYTTKKNDKKKPKPKVDATIPEFNEDDFNVKAPDKPLNIEEIKTQYPQYVVILKIIKKFEIELDNEMWNQMLPLICTVGRYNYSTTDIDVKSLLNLHRVLIGLGCKPDKGFLDKIIKNYTVNNAENDNGRRWFDKVLRYYDELNFDRDSIMNYMSCGAKFDGVKLVMNSNYCSYDMMCDIYYWMNGSNTNVKNYLLGRVIEMKRVDLYMHMVSMYHISFAHFKRYVELYPDCGWDNEHLVKNVISFTTDSSYVGHYVDNKLIVNEDILNYMWAEKSITNLYDTCTSYDEVGFDKMLSLRHETARLTVTSSSSLPCCSKAFRVLRSMSPRERRIYSHHLERSTSSMFDIEHILRYDIRITKPHLELFFAHGREDVIIRLLHISNRYSYLIDYIDLETILKCANYLPRMWFYNNIVLPKIVDGLSSDEMQFCRFDDADDYIFSVKQNEVENEDLSLDIIDQFDKIADDFRTNVQSVQESALDRILKHK
jgi:hypothetical protein